MSLHYKTVPDLTVVENIESTAVACLVSEGTQKERKVHTNLLISKFNL